MWNWVGLNLDFVVLVCTINSKFCQLLDLALIWDKDDYTICHMRDDDPRNQTLFHCSKNAWNKLNLEHFKAQWATFLAN